MSNLPLVTCIVPCYNHEYWVQDAIKSLVNQDYPNKRIVVINDGSVDKSWEKIQELLENKNVVGNDEPQIVTGTINDVLTITANFKDNHGPSFARNYGIRTGMQGTDLLAFLDSDDYYEKSKISKSVEAWLKNPNLIGVIYTDYSTVNIHNGLKQRQWKEPFSIVRLKQECIVNNDSVVSRKAIEECGMYDESLRVVEDFDWWLRIAKKFTLHHIAEDLLKIRVGRHSSTDTVKKEIWEECYRKVMEKNR